MTNNSNNIQLLPEIVAFRDKLKLIKEAGLDELYFQPSDRVDGCYLSIHKNTYLNFGSYDYLGLAKHPDVVKAANIALNHYGTSVSASRIISGDRVVTRDLELAIARLIGTEDSVVFSSGYMTILAALTHLFHKGDLIIYDQLAHNSTIMGALFSGASTMQFFHNNIEDLTLKLKHNRTKYKNVLIVVEGIYSMDGDVPPVQSLIELKNQYNCLLLIDEAHSIGVLGEHGAGIREYFNLSPNDIDIWMGTISKSFASCGGYLAGNAELITYLKYTAPMFIFSAGLSPPNAASALSAIQVISKENNRLKKLKSNSKLFLDLIKNAGLNYGTSIPDTPIIPVIIGDSRKTVEIAKALFKHHINAPPIIAPAVPNNQARIRFFITQQHSSEQLQETVENLIKII